MGNAKREDSFSMDVHLDNEFDLEVDITPPEPKSAPSDNIFKLDNSVSDDTDDFFREFNQPTQTPKKVTKQEILHEFHKINTKMNPQLHKMLKIFCSQRDIKKNDAFNEALKNYMAKNELKQIVFSKEVNGVDIELDLNNNLKKPYNFEVRKKFFKDVKTFSINKDLKLVDLYEQAIIDYLHTERYTL